MILENEVREQVKKFKFSCSFVNNRVIMDITTRGYIMIFIWIGLIFLVITSWLFVGVCKLFGKFDNIGWNIFLLPVYAVLSITILFVLGFSIIWGLLVTISI